MRHVMFVLAVVCTCAGASPSAQAGRSSENRLVGAWTGTYGGESTGKFAMSIARDAAGKLGGNLEVAPDEGGGYTVTLKTIAVDGDAVTIAYDAPGEDGLVQLDGSLDGKTLKGTWKVSDPGGGSVMSSGTFTSSKQ